MFAVNLYASAQLIWPDLMACDIEYIRSKCWEHAGYILKLNEYRKILIKNKLHYHVSIDQHKRILLHLYVHLTPPTPLLRSLETIHYNIMVS